MSNWARTVSDPVAPQLMRSGNKFEAPNRNFDVGSLSNDATLYVAFFIQIMMTLLLGVRVKKHERAIYFACSKTWSTSVWLRQSDNLKGSTAYCFTTS